MSNDNQKPSEPVQSQSTQNLQSLANATMPKDVEQSYQRVTNAMAMSHEAIQKSLQMSSALITQAAEHMQQVSLHQPQNQPHNSQEQGAPHTDQHGQAHSEPSQGGMYEAQAAEHNVMAAMEQQNQHMAKSMHEAMQAVQNSIHQATSQLQQSTSAREQALTHLSQGQQHLAAAAPAPPSGPVTENVNQTDPQGHGDINPLPPSDAAQ